jgi:lambda family phage portal protein
VSTKKSDTQSVPVNLFRDQPLPRPGRKSTGGFAKRKFDAADINRQTSSFNSYPTSIDRDLYSRIHILRARSRDLWANNEYAKRFSHQLRANVIGANGIGLQVRAMLRSGELDQVANRAVEYAHKRWSKRGNCEVTRKMSRADLERVVVDSVARDGEILVRMIPGYGNAHGYALQLIEADYLDHNMNEERTDGTSIRMGVELDEWGAPVRYYLHQKHPGDLHTSSMRNYNVVPAEEMLHLYIPLRPHQTRGVPWLHAAMINLWDTGGYREAAIIAARVGAAKMGIYTTPTGDEYQGDDTDSAGNIISDAEPGHFEQLPEGSTLEAWNPDYPHEQFGDFNKAMLRGIAGAIGVAYHSFANDLEGVNFSSSRAGILEERDMWMLLQTWLIEGLHEAYFPQWLLSAMMTSNVKLPSGVALPSRNQAKFADAAVWQGRRWPWVDPLKDMQTNQLAIDGRIRSISSVIRETGHDPDDVFNEIAEERKKLDELGISPGAAVAAMTEPDEDEKDEDETTQ